MLGLTYSGLLLLAAAALAAHPPAARSELSPANCSPGTSVSLKVAATTDVHGHIRGWDYYENRADPLRGLTRAATIVDSVRGQPGTSNPARRRRSVAGNAVGLCRGPRDKNASESDNRGDERDALRRGGDRQP